VNFIVSKNHTATIHRARWIVADPRTIYRDGFLTIENKKVKAVGAGPGGRYENVIDHGPGVIMPVLVNAHTHLELSSLKGQIPFDKGFVHWVRELLCRRAAADRDELVSGIKAGIDELVSSGCAVVGEISTLDLTWQLLSDSEVFGVWFKEYLGNILPEKIVCNKKNKNMAISCAGHAPHTTAPDIITCLKNACRSKGLPFSIHVAESIDEIEFLATGRGPWANFLKERGIDFSSWRLGAKTPVEHLKLLGIMDNNTIAVHLLFAQKEDFETLACHNIKVCICPRSNFNLHDKLPDLEKMLQVGLKPSLGTDSAASVASLSMFDEMAYAASVFPYVSPEKIFEMATINGSAALGLEDRFGSLLPGKYGAFIYLPVEVARKTDVIAALVTGDFNDYYKNMSAGKSSDS